MRYLLLFLLAIFAALYFTVGLRLGAVNLNQAYLLHATGVSQYAYQTDSPDEKVSLTGTCDVKSGKAILRFLSPQGIQLTGQECVTPGTFALNIVGGGFTGTYHLEVEYAQFTGHIKLDENRYGAHP